MAPTKTTCQGTWKDGKPCGFYSKLNARGYCPRHNNQSPSQTASLVGDQAAAGSTTNARTCRGTRRDNSRCQIGWDLDYSGYCIKHRLQSPRRPPQCVAIVRDENRRCCQTVGVNYQGFCARHGHKDMRNPRCQGRCRTTGQLCMNDAKMDYAFCCAQHDPAHVYIPTTVLDPKDIYLRNRVKDQVVELYHGRDIYHGNSLDLQTPYALHLDHIGEKQCFTDALCRLELHPHDADLEVAEDVLRESVVNEVYNLALTRASTNRIKGAAVWHFLDDSRTSHRGNKTFITYLLETKRDGEKIGRDVTAFITRAMGAAIKKSQRKLADEGDTPVLERLSIQLQQLYIEMELSTTRLS